VHEKIVHFPFSRNLDFDWMRSSTIPIGTYRADLLQATAA
jgi:hypothetical protein